MTYKVRTKTVQYGKSKYVVAFYDDDFPTEVAQICYRKGKPFNRTVNRGDSRYQKIVDLAKES